MDNRHSKELKGWRALSFGVALLGGVVIAGCVAGMDRGARTSSGGIGVLGLKKGWQGNYAAAVEWTVGTNVSSTNIDWVMEVVDVAEGERARAAVVRGFLKDLVWYEPGHERQFTVVAQEENRIYQIGCDDEAGGRLMARRIAAEGVAPGTEVWLDLPLAQDKRWAFDPERADLWYCWRVEEEGLETFAVKGVTGRETRRTWKVAYRSAPDHQIYTIADGIGLVGYEFGHHGTVAGAKVVLSSVNEVRK